MDRLIISQESDRLAVAAILVKNKYTVRQGSKRRQGSKSYDYYLEYEQNPVQEKPDVKRKDGADDEQD